MKKYFIFIFTSAFLTKIWYSDLFSNYYSSFVDVLLTLLLFYGASWLFWEIGKILLLFFAKGAAIFNREEKFNPNSLTDWMSCAVYVVLILIILNLLWRII